MYKASDYIYKEIIKEALVKDLTLKDEVILSLSNAEEVYDHPSEFFNEDDAESLLSEIKSEWRYSGEEINLFPTESSRHYEIDYVARQVGLVWVGWNFVYGGGKHSDPEAYDWISSANFLNVDKEVEVVKVVRTFSRKEEK